MNDGINRTINMDRINFDADDNYYTKNGNSKKKSYLKIGWFILLTITSILALFMLLKFNYNIDVLSLNLVNKDTYSTIIKALLTQYKTNIFQSVLTYVTLFLAYFSFFISIYNIFDIIMIPYWLMARNKKNRQWWRYEYLVFVCFLPIKLPFIIIKFSFKFLLALIGLDIDNLPTASPPQSASSYPNNPTPTSHNNYNNISRLTSEIVEIYSNAHSAGVPFEPHMLYNIDTSGLTQEEVQVALENARIYLNNLGYK